MVITMAKRQSLRIFSICGFVLISACFTDPNANPLTRVVTVCQESEHQGDSYFGEHWTRSNENGRESLELLYQALIALAEPSLACGSEPEEAYRLTEVPSMAPSATLVRVSRNHEAYELTASRPRSNLNGGHTVDRVQRTLSKDEWEAIVSTIKRMDVSKVRAIPVPSARPITQFDGTLGMLEFRFSGTYYFVARVDFRPERELQELRIRLLKAAGFGSD